MKMDLKENEKLVSPELQKLTYSGRIDFSDPLAPIFIFPASSVSMLFTGANLKILVRNNHSYYDNYIGYILDGQQKKILLLNDNNIQEITLVSGLEDSEIHEIILFKRQSTCHEFTFYGFITANDSEIITPPKKSRRCL